MAKKPTVPSLEGKRSPRPVVVAVRRKRGEGDTATLTVRIAKPDWVRLQELAMSEGTSMQALARAGLSRVFADRGLPPVGS